MEQEPTVIPIANETANNPPFAHDESVTTIVNKPIDVTLPVSDPDQNDELTASIVFQPSNGVLSNINQNTGVVTYTPNTDFASSDNFMFKVNDGKIDSNSGLVTIAVEQEEQQQIPISSITTPKISIADELGNLVSLLVKGVITKEEFALLKTTTITTVTGGTSITSKDTPPLVKDKEKNTNNLGQDCSCLPPKAGAMSDTEETLSSNNNVLQSGSGVGNPATTTDLGRLVLTIPKGGVSDIQFHHLFPQGGEGPTGGGRTLFKVLADIDIDDYLLPLPAGDHGKLHSVNNWNPEWEKKIAEIMNKYEIDKEVTKPIDPQTKAQIKKELESHLKEMLKKTGIENIENLKIFNKELKNKFDLLKKSYLKALQALKKTGKVAGKVLGCFPFLDGYVNIQDLLKALEEEDMEKAIVSAIKLGGDVSDAASMAGKQVASKASFLTRFAGALAYGIFFYENRAEFIHAAEIQKNMLNLDEIQTWTEALEEGNLDKYQLNSCESKPKSPSDAEDFGTQPVFQNQQDPNIESTTNLDKLSTTTIFNNRWIRQTCKS